MKTVDGMLPADKDVTAMLVAWQNGNREALDSLIPVIYEELHRISKAYLRKEKANHTLQATALVNEAYMRLVKQDRATWKNRAHFLSVAAQMMRRILINYWQERNAAKRGGDVLMLTLEEAIDSARQQKLDLTDLNEGLIKLAEFDARKAQLVELKFFGGLTEEEIAEVLSVSVATVRRDWKAARAWLYRFLNKKKDESS